jgi:broad specificity phosphatase PhoE
MKIVLLRHGESLANVRGIIDSNEPGALLTKRGFDQIEMIKPRVHQFVDEGLLKCYCSPFKRAIQTFNALDISIPMILDERIREFDYGRFDQVNISDISHIIKKYFSNAENGIIYNKIGVCGESYYALVSRTYLFIAELLEKNEDALIISHDSIFLEIGKLWKVLNSNLVAEGISIKQGELLNLNCSLKDVGLIHRHLNEIKNLRVSGR